MEKQDASNVLLLTQLLNNPEENGMPVGGVWKGSSLGL